MLNKKSIEIDFNGISLIGKKFKDWSPKMQEAFIEGFQSNTLSSNNYKAVYGANIGSSSTNKSSSKDFDDKNGHWVTVNHKHIFIEDEKGGKKGKSSSSKTSSNKSTNPNKMKGNPTGGAASITKNSKKNIKEDKAPYSKEQYRVKNVSHKIKSKNFDTKLQEYLLGIYNDYKGITDPVNTVMYALGVFLTNFQEMKDADTHGADKYFHARANYEAAQQGLVGSLVAKIISDLRELSDSYRNIYEKGYSKEYSDIDIKEDQNANNEGRLLGRKHPMLPAYKILKKFMPNGFPERYRKI